MTNFVLEAVASLARLAVHFDDSDKGDGMRNLAVKARQQHDAERKVIEAAKAMYAARQLRYGKARDDREDVALYRMDEAVKALERM